MGAPSTKINDMIGELAGEISDINADIDLVNQQIRENQKLPASREEIQAALVAQITAGAERYREKFSSQLSSLAPALHDVAPVPGAPPQTRAWKRAETINLLPIRDFIADSAPSPPDYQIIADGFCFLASKIGNPVIDDLMAVAPPHGISQQEKKDTDAKLRAKKRELEMKLEDVYCELENAGFKPDRRPDLSVEVFLEFESKEKWSANKLERYREHRIGERAAASRLTEKRNNLIFERNKADESIRRHQANGAPDNDPTITGLKRQIATLSAEEKDLTDQIRVGNEMLARSLKLFNNCIQFLHAQKIDVDHHL